MRLRLILSAAGITAATLLPSVAVTAAPTSPAAPAATTAPTAPRTPAITRGHGQITVTWTAPASTGGSPVLSYRVRVEPGHRVVAVAAPATSATVTGLADGTSVTATVEAVNALGTSPTAAAGSAIPTPPITGGYLPDDVEAHAIDLAVAPDQTLYVATDDTIYRREFGATTFTALDLGAIEPWSIAVGADGTLFWADDQPGGILIRRYDGGPVTTVAGTTTAEAAPWPSTTPTPALSTRIPAVLELAVNHSDGSVFVLDYLNGTVSRFTVGGSIAVVAGGGGHPGTFAGDGGPAIDANFNGPQGLAISEYGTVYVAETWSHRVRAFTVGGTISTVAGDGTTTIDPAPDVEATATGVPYPSRIIWMPTKGLLIDSSGRKRLLAGDQVVGDRLLRIGDDAFDRALFDSPFPPGDGIIGANDNTRALAWDAEAIWGIYVVHDAATDTWHRELRAAGPWLPASVPTEHPGFGSWEDLVTLHFRAFINRPPTAEERTVWATHLTNGTQVPGELDEYLRGTKENTTNVDPVVRLYRAFLGRAPDANGLRYWIAKRRSVAPAKTWSMTQLANQFTASSEFQRKYGSLSNHAFVTRIYTDVLNRPADPSGVAFWTKQLDTKRRTRATVMVGLSESAEYQRKQAANTDVAVAYLALVGRMPTIEETEAWTTAAASGTTTIELLDQLVKVAPSLI